MKKTTTVYRLAASPKHRTPVALASEQRMIRSVAPQSPVFAKVAAPLAAWSEATDVLEGLQRELDSAEQRVRELRMRFHQANERFRVLERAYRGAVQLASEGDPGLINSLGYGAATGKAAAASSLAPPEGLVGAPGASPGVVELKWRPLGGKRSFALERSASPKDEGSWVGLKGTSRSRYRVGELTPGQMMWFRVATVGVGEQSAWSEPVAVLVRLKRPSEPPCAWPTSLFTAPRQP